MQKISLREATEADSNAVYAIKKAAISHYVETQHGGWDELEQHRYHRERFATQDTRIITVDKDTVGYVSLVSEAGVIKVNQLMIQPEYQGKGIGAHCMALIRKEARKTGIPVYLQVMKVNPRALKFYQHVGFSITGETETHYQMELSS